MTDLHARPNAYRDAEPGRMRAFADGVAERGDAHLAEILRVTADEIERHWTTTPGSSSSGGD